MNHLPEIVTKYFPLHNIFVLNTLQKSQINTVFPLQQSSSWLDPATGVSDDSYTAAHTVPGGASVAVPPGYKISVRQLYGDYGTTTVKTDKFQYVQETC